MGATASFQQRQSQSASAMKAMVATAMPDYYVRDQATHTHIKIARTSWRMVYTSDSPAFNVLRTKHGFERGSYSSEEGLYIFKAEFLARLRYMYPETAMQFDRSDEVDSPWILMVADLCLDLVDDAEGTTEHISGFTKMHSASGVRPHQYGEVGSVFMWTLRLCLGSFYDAAMDVAWTVLFSSLLRTIVPIAVSNESLAQVVRK